MGLRYRNAQGVETRVAGLTPGGGDIEIGAVATRSGNFTIPSISADDATEKTVTVTFTEEMPDGSYEIIFNDTSSEQCIFRARNKTSTGFTAYFMNVAGTYVGSHNVSYTAFKLYTVADAERLMSEVDRLSVVIPVSASSTNQLATVKQVTDGDAALQEAVDDIQDVIPATASIENKLLTEANISNKLDTYTSDSTQWDITPTANSNKPITSGGVYNALATTNMAVTKQGSYINGTNFYGRKNGKVAMIEIYGSTGSAIPWGQTTIVAKTTGCATGIMELKCTADMLSIVTGFNTDGSAITRYIPPYARAWIDSAGQVNVFLANPGASATNYTLNLFIGGSYITV